MNTHKQINKPQDPIGIDIMLNFVDSIIHDRTAIYISTPITTGPRFLEWFKEKGISLHPETQEYQNSLFQYVIQPNTEEVKKKIASIRQQYNDFILDPTRFNYPHWTQDDFRYFWGSILERHVKTAIFLDGWQYSRGCSYEFLVCLRSRIQTLNEAFDNLERETAIQMIEDAIHAYNQAGISTHYLEQITSQLKNNKKLESEHSTQIKVEHEYNNLSDSKGHFKDAILDRLSLTGNIAQFISFDADTHLPQRFAHIHGFPPNHPFTSPQSAITNLIANSPEGTVNIRSFQPGNPKGEPLLYGLKNVKDIIGLLKQKASENKITIVNETIDIHDGGVSGVLIGDIIEFSPGDTPKCVDKPGVCSLPRNIGIQILETVYQFHPALNFPPSWRVEFSIHPIKRGIHQSNTILWELEEVNTSDNLPEINWPNNFSRKLGDKAFGLLIADAIGLPVPFTTLITSSNIPPFSFGRKTGSPDIWMRTCPETRVPGKYPTFYGWRDPFQLMNEEDQNRKQNNLLAPIVSILAQQAVNPQYSGSLLTPHLTEKEPLIEGVRGKGDHFMLGEASPIQLPQEVIEAVKKLFQLALKYLGPIEMEWVYDGERAWVVQLHKSNPVSSGEIIYPGEPFKFIDFEVKQGLEALRQLIPLAEKELVGIRLIGDVGITSHFGDILRKAKIPSRISRIC